MLHALISRLFRPLRIFSVWMRVIGRNEGNREIKNPRPDIGYGVRLSERHKGYATQMLKMALTYAGQIGLSKVMLACYKDNEASGKTIQKCNGILEREFSHTDGKIIQIYWIEF